MDWPDDYINQIVQGDALKVLRNIPDQVIQTCITSPPYWGLRDYGVGGQLGLESTPQEYVDKIVQVFCEVRRVLRDDGTLWLNLGDSYCGSWGNYGSQNRGNGKQRSITKGSSAPSAQGNYLPPTARVPGLKPKDMVGIPWMVAFALRADGWYLRSEIIWRKTKVMPESVIDRPTKAHEHLFLLAKNPKYYYDGDAIAEPVADSTVKRLSQDIGNQAGSERAHGGTKSNGPMRAVAGTRVHGNIPGRSDAGKISKRDTFSRTGPISNHILPSQGSAEHRQGRVEHPPNDMRNKRSVWDIANQGFKGAHFATFPIKLIELCILAGSRGQDRSAFPRVIGGLEKDIVLDPFMGSGTVGLRSKELGRAYVGIELSPKYKAMADRRLCQQEIF